MTDKMIEAVAEAKRMIGSFANISPEHIREMTLAEILSVVWRHPYGKEQVGYKCANILAAIVDDHAAMQPFIQQGCAAPIEITPCPYVNGFSARTDNSDVSFMFKPYPDYSDLIVFYHGKPSRCFRFTTTPPKEPNQPKGD